MGKNKCKISACLIVKNEGKLIERCLRSVNRLADEVIVVDTGSIDNTIDLAAGLGARTYTFPWKDDFSAARNYSLSKATGNWVIWLDADDVISPADARKIRKLAEKAPRKADGFMLPYFLGQNGKGKYTSKLYRLRIFRNGKNISFRYPIHEILGIGSLHTEYSDKAGICHMPPAGKKHSVRNLRILIASLLLPQYKNDLHLLFHLGKEYQAFGETEKAIEIYKRCLKLSRLPSQKFLFNNRIASCFESMAKPGKMLKHAYMAFKADPSLPDSYIKISKYFNYKKNIKSASFWRDIAYALPHKLSPDVMRIASL